MDMMILKCKEEPCEKNSRVTPKQVIGGFVTKILVDQQVRDDTRQIIGTDNTLLYRCIHCHEMCIHNSCVCRYDMPTNQLIQSLLGQLQHDGN